MKQYYVLKRFSCMLLFIALFLFSLSANAQEKKKRVFRSKQLMDTFMTEKFTKGKIDSFIVKFAEGTRIRLRGKQFVTYNIADTTSKEMHLLKDNKLNVDTLQKEVVKINMALKDIPLVIKRYFERPEQEIADEQDSLENKAHEELADLNLYYLVVLKVGAAKPLIEFLNKFKIIENAYPVYKVENAMIKNNAAAYTKTTAIITDDYSDRQEYLNPAPRGIDAKYAWTINGGKGDGIRIIDVEYKWDLDHEDLKVPFWASSIDVKSNGDASGDHGTSVLGEIIGKHNNIGVKGISPAVAYGVSGVKGYLVHTLAVSSAIDKASTKLKAGDIILIEQHTPGPPTGGIDSTCNPDQFEYVPMEYYQDCFDAIRRATAKGIIVVEAGGNGGMNLDAALYQDLFNRNVRDSKAIMVAGDQGGNGIPTCWTNYGKRIDFYAWGQNIVTTGYGDLSWDMDNKKYTARFGGTSGASPIIVGAIACMQGIRKRMGLNPWDADLIRKKLIGTAQVPGSKFIGVMPDLRASILNINTP